VLAFALTLVPYLGIVLTLAIASAIAWATVGPAAAGILIVAVGVEKLIVGYVIRARFRDPGLAIAPIVFVIALASGLALDGLPGMIVAIPIVGVAVHFVPAIVDALRTPISGGPPGIPTWLDRLGQWSWRLLVVAGVGALAVVIIEAIPIVVIALTLAIIVASTLKPLVDALVRRGSGRTAAALAATLGSVVIVVGVLGVTVVSLTRGLGDISDSAGSAGATIDAATGGGLAWIRELIEGSRLVLLRNAADVARDGIGLLLAVGTALVMCFFALRDGPETWRFLVNRLPAARGKVLDELGPKAIRVLGGYMAGTAAISAFGAVSQFATMAILGLPLALPLAILVFIGGFIPYIGSALGTILAFVVTLEVGTTRDVVVMAIFTVIFNIVQGSVVTPIVYSRVVAIHAAIVLVAVPAAYEVAGVLGMFLVVPLLGVIAATWRAALHVLDDDLQSLLHGADSATSDGSSIDAHPAEPGLDLPDPRLEPGSGRAGA
jgi:predicted PurR-regulated permease PerM